MSTATASLTVVLRSHVLSATMRRRDVTAATRVSDCATTQHPQVQHLHELHGSWVTWVMGQPLSTPIRCGTYTNSTGHGSSESWVNNSALPDAVLTRTPRVIGSSESWVNNSALPDAALTRTPQVMGQVSHGSAHPQVWHLHVHRSWVTWVMGQPLSTPDATLTRTPRVMGQVGHWSAHPQVRHLRELHGSWVTWVMGQRI